MKDPTLTWALWAAVVALFGLLAATVRAVIRGDLVPRKVLEDANARADKWEATYDKNATRLDQFDGRFEALTEAAELNTTLLQSLVERART
jgi:hypothetical protein